MNCPDPSNQLYFYSVTFASCSLNLILLFLIRRNRNTLIQPYIKILYTSVIIDLVSGLIQCLVQMRPLLLGESGILTMAMDGLLPRLVQNWHIFAGGRLNFVLSLQYFACYSLLVYNIISFSFYYTVICRGYEMSKTVFGFVTFFVLAMAFQASILVCYLSSLVHEDNMRLIPNNSNPDCVRLLPQISHLHNLGDPHIRFVYTIWRYSSLLLPSSYVVILYFACRIFCLLHKQAKMISPENNHVQRQIVVIMGARTLLPIIVYYWPFLAVIGLSVSKGQLNQLIFNTQSVRAIVFKMYALIPLLNAIVSIILVNMYREAFLGFFSRVWNNISTIRSSSVRPAGSVLVL